jgi:hypothetical protein
MPSTREMMTQQADLLGMALHNIGPMLILYAYFAICIFVLARKTQTPYDWLAFIPIANLVLLFWIGEKPWWWIFLMLIPLVNLIFIVLTWMAIARRRGKAGWLGILILVPVVNLVVPGYLAFSK